ncbi:MAG: FtsH protease activity modulator HflK, partial [Lachnospiraceae bacterium]|nr:FtsH protease activity modulator HflK [Lachnospiraceae bacterium]
MKINKDKAKKGIMLVVAVFIVAVLGFNSFFTIKEQEQAVVTTFGVPKAVTDPGLHFKIPFVQGVR